MQQHLAPLEIILQTAPKCTNWINEYGNYFIGMYDGSINTKTVLTTDSLTYTVSKNGIDYTLVTDGTTLISITVAGCSNDAYNGTYRDPATENNC